MLVTLLFSLARPKYSRIILGLTIFIIVVSDVGLNIFFYLRSDYTTVGKLDIVFFIIIGVAIKILFQETIMQWMFNCLTTMNVYAAVVVLTYYLADLFPYPCYAITVLRVLLFAAVILFFRRYLRPLYRQVAKNWSVYLFVVAGLFMNMAWYFMASDDVVQTLNSNIVPILLLVLLEILVYLTVFLSLRKTLYEAMLQEENLKIYSDRELTRQRLVLMDEAVRQMSITQHDRRHFNNTILSLLEQGEIKKATELIRKQSEVLPQKPQSYCENIPVNAAVSYYVELARQRGIRCEIRLDIPDKLPVDELSLAMVVSNLMENAINAVFKMPNHREGVVRFMAVNTGQFILEISNPYEDEVLLDQNGTPISTEKEHGQGTQSVADFVNKCGGQLVYDISGGIFKVRIMF